MPTFRTIALLCLFLFSSLDARMVDIAIIGGGPGGLAAALALERNCPVGTTIRVFERDNFEPKGASIAISKGGWKDLRNVVPELFATLEPRIRSTGVSITSITISGFDSTSPAESRFVRAMLRVVNGGSLVFQGLTAVANRLLRRRWNRPAIRMSHLWHDVRMALADAVSEKCGAGTICGGHSLVSLTELEGQGASSGFELTFEVAPSSGSGEPEAAGAVKVVEKVSCGAVLACDGVGSSVRRLAVKEPKASAVFTGEGRSVWRGVAPKINLGGKASFFKGGSSKGGSSKGGDATSSGVVFPAGAAEGASWAIIAPLAEGRSTDSASARLRATEALEAACNGSSAPPLLVSAIGGSERVVEHRLFYRNFGEGAAPYAAATAGLSFLGDAQHPVRPTGQGVALAWADAAALGKCCAEAAAAALTELPPGAAPAPFSADDMAGVLSAYEAMREPEVRKVAARVDAAADASPRFFIRRNLYWK